jgi:hypothetical protein
LGGLTASLTDPERQEIAVKVSREYVEDILARTDLTPDEKQRVRELSYPAEQDELLQVFASLGVTPDRLRNHMGGSP